MAADGGIIIIPPGMPGTFVDMGIPIGMGMGIALPAGAAIIIMHGIICVGLRGLGIIIIMGIMPPGKVRS